MSKVEESKTPVICERCDRESAHMAELKEPDNRVHHVCWSCLYRTEKRINVSQRWQRARRG
jgi:transcription elongation factor Elf1